MNLCIDITTLNKGGGLQVAETFIKDLIDFELDNFNKIIVISNGFIPNSILKEEVEFLNIDNLSGYNFIKNSIKLNKIFSKYSIDIVFTIFGPPRYFTNIKHVVGFARPHIVYSDSPYFNKINFSQYIKLKIKYLILSLIFVFQSSVIIVETEDVKNRLKNKILFKNKNILVVENCINQSFIKYRYWKKKDLNKIKILFVSSFYDHKNFNFFIDFAEKIANSDLKNNILITLTIKSNEIKVPDHLLKYFNFLGKVETHDLPEIYNKHNLVIHPSLLECFSACYIEAIYSNTMLIVPDLPFAQSILFNYPFYIKNMDVDNCIKLIKDNFNNFYLNDHSLKYQFFNNYFDSTIRTKKYIKILKSIYV